MQKFKTLLLLALAGMLLASCASLVGPRSVELPLHKLQASLDKRFPMNNRVLELFEIDLSRPQLSLDPDQGRVALAVDAMVAPPFLRQSWRGQLALSGRLVIDPVRSVVLLAEPRVERFTVEGVDEARQRQLGRVAGVLLDKVTTDLTLYHFRPEDLRYAGVQFVPTIINVTARGLSVSLEPAR
jgi:hypothetical protein